jgi:hypothetical protein
LSHVGLKPNALGRLPAAGGAGLNEHAVADVTRAREPLDVFEAVVATESADGLAFLIDKRQPRMLSDGLPQLFQVPVNGFLAEGRLEGSRTKKDVDVFRNPLAVSLHIHAEPSH